MAACRSASCGANWIDGWVLERDLRMSLPSSITHEPKGKTSGGDVFVMRSLLDQTIEKTSRGPLD